MTADEFNMTVRQLSKVYDIVRAVDVGRQRVITFDANGRIDIDCKNHCYDAWNKNGRCQNCVSGMAFRQKNRVSKFEFIGHDIFHVTSQYLTVDGHPCIMEIVEKDSDASLTGAFGNHEFIEKIRHYTEQVYTDSLTRVSNRRYFDEQISSLEMDALAMIDVDHFKLVNDTHGHLCGDQALKYIAKTIRSNVRNEDSVIRYGGDEFLVAFSVMDPKCFPERMEMLRSKVEQIVLPDYPNVSLSVSIGGITGRGQVQELIARADEELYLAKRTRNSISVKTGNGLL